MLCAAMLYCPLLFVVNCGINAYVEQPELGLVEQEPPLDVEALIDILELGWNLMSRSQCPNTWT